MSWDENWKLPPTGGELFTSDGYAGIAYKAFLEGLSAEDMATYSAGLEAKLNETYKGNAKLVADLMGYFNRSKPSKGGRRPRRSRKARKSRKAKRASRSTRRR